jgi:hypothetical protein
MVAAVNRYCETLGIAVPSLAAVRTHREAKTYALGSRRRPIRDISMMRARICYPR